MKPIAVTDKTVRVTHSSVNGPALLYVADVIEKGGLVKEGVGFNMALVFGLVDQVSEEEPTLVDHTGHSCGKVACVAGTTVCVFDGVAQDGAASNKIVDRARELLELDYDRAADLFEFFEFEDLSAITNHHAAAVMRHLAFTGEVDWGVGAPD